MKWIPCKERLPEKGGDYIVTSQTYDLATKSKRVGDPRIDQAEYDTRTGWRRANFIKVTAWLDCEPYEEELE